MEKRIKVLLLSDHPMVPSGVGTQARYVIEGLLATNKYKFVVFGGAIRHPDYRPQVIAPEKFGDGNFIVLPVDGYGDKEKLRAVLQQERPDVLMLFTDPRFFTWVWEMEDEVHEYCPIVYWHVWDNDPEPSYNKIFYDSTDHISALSLKTFGLLQSLGHKSFNYIPHAVSPDIFKPLSEKECQEFKEKNLGPHAKKKFLLFWNNRNARRKMTGDVIVAFSKFANDVGKENTSLVMHTSVSDPEGQNIIEVARKFGVESNLVISEERLPAEILNCFYNACDCTINIANNEGFGLGTLESLMAGTPIIAHMTGGLQFQMGDWWEKLREFNDQDKMTKIAKSLYPGNRAKWWGVPVFSSTRSCTGSQPIPYIYDDRCSHEDVVAALKKLYMRGREERRKIGLEASIWARQNFSIDTMINSWDDVLSTQSELFKKKKNDSKIRVVGI